MGLQRQGRRSRLASGGARVVALGLALGGCLDRGTRSDGTAHLVAPVPARTALALDCTQDSGCDVAAGMVCHPQVLGGTCAPPCSADDFCAGMEAPLACVQGRCVSAPLDAGLPAVP